MAELRSLPLNMTMRALLGLFLLVVAGCSNVERITLGVCGNHIVDEGEACDGTTQCTAECQLSCSATLSCPDGLGCDLGAGECRVASGTFTDRVSLGSSEARPYVADFDGDRRDDLLLVGKDEREAYPSTVYFFDPGVSASTAVRLPRARSVATGDVSDERLVVLGGARLLGYRALPNRNFSPVAGESRPVAANTQLFSADFDADGQRDLMYLEGSKLSVIRTATELASQDEIGLDAADLIRHDLLGDPVEPLSTVSSFRKSSGERAEVLALFVPGQSSVQVFGIAEGETKRARLLSSSAIPDMFFAPNGLFSADVNGDGRDDLLLGIDVSQPMVAYGAGDGTFGAFSQYDGCNCVGLVAVGQFDRDPAVDFFDGAQPAGVGVRFGSYSRALVADLTGDGLDDVASVLGERGFDVLRGHPTGAFSRVAISTARRAQLRDTADLDGDGLPDVVLTEGSDTNDWGQISLLFSPVTAESTRVDQVAEVPHIQQIVAGYLADSRGERDAYADLAVLHADDSGALQLGFLEGGIDRLLSAPLATENDTSNDDDVSSSRWPAIGRFRSRGAPELLTVLGANDGSTPLSVQLLALDANGASSVGKATLSATGLPHSVLRADLDSNGLDELYVLFQNQPLVRVELSGGGTAALQARETALAPEPLSMLGSDVDGDGLGDLSLFEFGSITVLFATKASGTRSLRLAIPDDLCAGVPPLTHAWVQADRDRELELVLNCLATDTEPAQLHVLDVDFESGELTALPSQPGFDAETLVAGDFNGDGVQDLASGEGTVTVLFGRASR